MNRLRKRNQQRITGQSTYMITLYNFSIYDTTTWILDIESSIHICNSLQKLQVSREFKKSEWFLNVGDGRAIPVLAIEKIQFALNSNAIILNDYYYCPSFLINVIFIELLIKDGYNFSIKKSYCNIIMNGITIMCT